MITQKISNDLKRVIHEHSQMVFYVADFTIEQLEEKLHDDVIELIKNESNKESKYANLNA